MRQKPHQVQMQTAHGTHRAMDRAGQKEMALESTLKMHILGFVSKEQREVTDTAPTSSSASQEAQPEPLGAAGRVFLSSSARLDRAKREQPWLKLILGKTNPNKQLKLQVAKLIPFTCRDHSPWD